MTESRRPNRGFRLFSQHCFFLLFPSMYSCRHEITICSTWSCSQKKKCITDHFGSVRSDILMPLFHISLLSMLRWSSLTWPKMLQPETARCMRMAWFELLGAARLYGFSVTNLLDFLACCYVIELCGKYRSMLCKGSVNEWLLIFFFQAEFISRPDYCWYGKLSPWYVNKFSCASLTFEIVRQLYLGRWTDCEGCG